MTSFTETFTQENRRDFVEPADLLFGWDRAIRAIRGFQNLPGDWDGAGAIAVPRAIIISAIRFCQLMRAAKHHPPASAYPLADGHIMIEWRYPNGVILRLEVEDHGRGEVMTTYSDGRAADFREYRWNMDAPVFSTYSDSEIHSGGVLVTRAMHRRKPCAGANPPFAVAA